MCPKPNRLTPLLFVLFPFFVMTLFSFVFFEKGKTMKHYHEIKASKSDKTTRKRLYQQHLSIAHGFNRGI